MLPYLVALAIRQALWLALRDRSVLLTFASDHDAVLHDTLAACDWRRSRVRAGRLRGHVRLLLLVGLRLVHAGGAPDVRVPGRVRSAGRHANLGAKYSTTSAAAASVFFSHGITFGISLAIASCSWLLRGRWFARFRCRVARRASRNHGRRVARLCDTRTPRPKQSGNGSTRRRADTLFSGAFTTFPDEHWAIVSASAVAVFLLLARPKLTFAPLRWLPLVLITLIFVALPDVIASTWYVATRFCVFIHVLAPAVLDAANQ